MCYRIPAVRVQLFGIQFKTLLADELLLADKLCLHIHSCSSMYKVSRFAFYLGSRVKVRGTLVSHHGCYWYPQSPVYLIR